MAKDKLIKRTKVHQNAPHFFQLPKVKAYNLHNYRHEWMAGELYVSYKTSGELRFWGYDYDKEMEGLGLKPDRTSNIGGQIIFWEVDRGTEPLEVIKDKVAKYIRLSGGKPRFNVVFVGSRGRMNSVLKEILYPVRSKVWFFVAEFDAVVQTPLGSVFVSPVNPAQFTSLWG